MPNKLDGFKTYKFVPIEEVGKGMEKESAKPIVRHFSDGAIRNYQCPLCAKRIYHMDNYCRGCGVKMDWT